jgi:hypothetical protein
MRRPVSAAIAACVLAAMPLASARAEALPAGGLTIDELAQALKRAELPVTLKKTDSGEAYVESRAEGTTFQVWLYDCKQSRCASIQFQAAYDAENGLDPGKVNEWNRDKRYVRMWLDEQRDPYFQYDVNVAPGGTFEALKDEIGVWKTYLPEFRRFSTE